MAEWIGQDYFWIAIAAPSLLALWALMSSWPEARKEVRLWACSVVLTSILVMPTVQTHLHVFGQNQFNLYVFPVFVIAYLVWGQYELPSVRLTFAGTFLSLLIAYIVGAWLLVPSVTPNEDPFFMHVGGTGLFDGLVLIPAASALLIAGIKIVLRTGSPLSFLLGRKKYLAEK